jgi:ribosome maturation factor RimP
VDAEALVRPVVERAGLDLAEVVFRTEHGRRVLRVVVDRDEPLDLDTISEISERVSRRLDLEGFGRGRYELEVSSPGIERSLRTPAQYRRAIGRQVRIKTAAPVEDSRTHTGALVAADDLTVTVLVDGAERRISIADVASARTVVDWDAELKRSRA